MPVRSRRTVSLLSVNLDPDSLGNLVGLLLLRLVDIDVAPIAKWFYSEGVRMSRGRPAL